MQHNKIHYNHRSDKRIDHSRYSSYRHIEDSLYCFITNFQLPWLPKKLYHILPACFAEKNLKQTLLAKYKKLPYLLRPYQGKIVPVMKTIVFPAGSNVIAFSFRQWVSNFRGCKASAVINMTSPGCVLWFYKIPVSALKK